MTGHRPPRGGSTTEEFHLGRARSAYVEGRITVERFELLTAHVLAGGTLTGSLEPGPAVLPPPPPARPAIPTYR